MLPPSPWKNETFNSTNKTDTFKQCILALSFVPARERALVYKSLDAVEWSGVESTQNLSLCLNHRRSQ